MRLPSFKKSPRGAGVVVDAKVTKVKSSVPPLPPTIVERVAPDYGDYAAEYPEPLPHQWRFMPYVFWAVIAIALGLYAMNANKNGSLVTRLKTVNAGLTAEKNTGAAIASEAQAIEGKMVDLQKVRYWVGVGAPVRDVALAAASAANERVQIRSLEIKRRDVSILRYTIQINCGGSRSSFDAMRADLVKRLTDAGWNVNESPPDAEDPRMIFDAQISRKG